MSLEEIALTLFAACNSFRVVAYVPQILKAANDRNGASSISFMTWFLFLLAHLSTVAYALINRSDWGLATCFAINAICCVAILVIAYWKRRSHAKQLDCKDRPALCVAA
jgi:PQ loop repeat